MKTFLALLCGWFLGLFTVAMVAGTALAQLAGDSRGFLDARAVVV